MQHETMVEFLKSKFDALIVFIILLVVYITWVHFNFNSEIKEFLIAVFGAFLALIGVRPRPNQQTDIQADNIERASTETGDIKVSDATKTTSKEIEE